MASIKNKYLNFPIRNMSDVYQFVYLVNINGHLDRETLEWVSQGVNREARTLFNALVVNRYDEENECIKVRSEQNKGDNVHEIRACKFKYKKDSIVYDKHILKDSRIFNLPKEYWPFVKGTFSITFNSENEFSFVRKTDINRLVRAMKNSFILRLKEIEKMEVKRYLQKIPNCYRAEIAECYTYEEDGKRMCRISSENIISSDALNKNNLVDFYHQMTLKLSDSDLMKRFMVSYSPISYSDFVAECQKAFYDFKNGYDKTLSFDGEKGDMSDSTRIVELHIVNGNAFNYSRRFDAEQFSTPSFILNEAQIDILDKLVEESFPRPEFGFSVYEEQLSEKANEILNSAKIGYGILNARTMIIDDIAKNSTRIPNYVKDYDSIVCFNELLTHFSDEDTFNPDRIHVELYIKNNRIAHYPIAYNLSTYIYSIDKEDNIPLAVFIIIAYFSSKGLNKRESFPERIASLFHKFGITDMYKTSHPITLLF